MRALVFIVALGISPIAYGANEAAPALPIRQSSEPEVSDELVKELSHLLNSALMLLQIFPPAGYENNLFNWSADRKILTGKDFQIVWATSKTPAFAPLLENSGATGIDAFTMAPMNVDKKTMQIYVVLLVDKIFYDSTGRELPNGFSKLVVALAHEIFGNTQHFLEMKMENLKPQTMADRIAQEQKAYRASILFLNGLVKSPQFVTLPSSMRDGLRGLLPIELIGYQSWLRANPSAKPDPACAALLKSLREKSN